MCFLESKKISRLYYVRPSKISKSGEAPTTIKPKIYLDYVPQKSKLVVKDNKCIYDADTHKWYTVDEKSTMIHDFTKKNFNFWEFMNDIGVQFDKETKQ